MMKKFSKTNLNNIPIEDAHGGTGKKQMLVRNEDLKTEHFEALTKGFLNSGASFDWHLHEDVDELFIVIKGQGKFYCEDDVIDYVEDDIITIQANAKHKISAEGDTQSEFYFVRVKV